MMENQKTLETKEIKSENLTKPAQPLVVNDIGYVGFNKYEEAALRVLCSIASRKGTLDKHDVNEAVHYSELLLTKVKKDT